MKILAVNCVILAALLVCLCSRCQSPEDVCEESRDSDGLVEACMLQVSSFSYSDCMDRETAGELEAGKCKKMQQLMLMMCVEQLAQKEKCEKESDVPFLLK